uniref:Uncharacterized protein n=1 Tax=Oryza glumipatula TaxID=40148 RepID=A0A0D9Z3H1_9ORYZ
MSASPRHKVKTLRRYPPPPMDAYGKAGGVDDHHLHHQHHQYPPQPPPPMDAYGKAVGVDDHHLHHQHHQYPPQPPPPMGYPGAHPYPPPPQPYGYPPPQMYPPPRRRLRRTGTSAPRSARDASRPFVAAASWTYASDDEERRSNYRMQSPAKMACSEGIYTTTYVDGPFYVIAG